MVNLVINVLFCLCILGLVAAAVTAWWTRRPVGARRLVPPPLPREMRTWRAAVGLMFALSLVFPLVAVTIAVVLVLDTLVLRRVRGLRALFQ